MSCKTKEKLDGADVLIAIIRISLDHHKLRADQKNDRVHNCNQQISVLRRLIYTSLKSVQKEHERVALVIDANLDVHARSLPQLSMTVWGALRSFDGLPISIL